MDAWSGGAYDTRRDRLIVWGGGHADYAGNEVYTFDLNSLKWQRLTNPSPYSSPDSSSWDYNPDNTPVSVHTYDGLEYLPNVDRFWTHGGSRWRSGYAHQLTWTFDFAALRWSRRADSPACAQLEMVSAYDPVTGHVFVSGPASCSGFYAYDPVANTWTQKSDRGVRYHQVAAIDPVRRKFVSIGDGYVYAHSLTTGTRQTLNTTGATAILNETYPGFTYDSVSDRFVAWDGGPYVYVLNMDTLQWTRLSPTNSVTPTPSTPNGTFGRWQYVPSKNVFIGVNKTDQNVWIYKLSPGGNSSPSAPPSAPSALQLLGGAQ
jgi:hypothetical protein